MSTKTEILEIRISLFLRYGVLVAGALMLVGWLANLDLGNNPFAQFSQYHELPLFQVIATAIEKRDFTVLLSYAGLFCLISLPIIRVLLTAVLFLKERQFVMAALASFVFGALILSFALGFHIG